MGRPRYVAPTWDQIYDMLVDLAMQVKRSGFNPDVIVGVSRGGWPPARIMSDLLGNPNLANIRVEFYKGINLTNKTPKITQPVTSNVRGRSVLVVDDVADTGKSLKAVRNHLKRKKAGEVRVCTIYYKPHSIYTPDYYAKKTSSWVIFPWERVEALRLIGSKFKDNGRLTTSLVRELKGSGLSSLMIRRLLRINPDAN